MNATRKNQRAFTWLALGALFFTVSLAASLHHAEHDPVTSLGKVCSVCVSATQLGSALLNSESVPSLELARPHYESPVQDWLATFETVAVRQRGPPATFSS